MRIARGNRKMEGNNTVCIYLSVFSEIFETIEFLFIKINRSYRFAGNESDDDVKDHEVIAIDSLV